MKGRECHAGKRARHHRGADDADADGATDASRRVAADAQAEVAAAAAAAAPPARAAADAAWLGAAQREQTKVLGSLTARVRAAARQRAHRSPSDEHVRDALRRRLSAGLGEAAGVKAWNRFNDMFQWLPLAAVIEDRVACMHRLPAASGRRAHRRE